MITPDMALQLIDREDPEGKVLTFADYDAQYYIANVGSQTDSDYSGIWYRVDKKTGDIYSFAPFEDLKKFNEALSKRMLPIDVD